MTTTSPRGTSVELLLEDAWTLDCAIRLRQSAWAGAAAARLAAQLARHEEDALHAWNPVDHALGETLAAEARAVRVAVSGLIPGLEQGGSWPRPNLHDRVALLIHHEVVAVADAAERLD